MGDHAKERFESIIENASSIMEERKQLLEKKANMIRASGLSSTEESVLFGLLISSDKVALARIKNDLEKSEHELSSIVSAAYSVTSSFFHSTNSLLDSAFTHLLSSMHIPTQATLSPVVKHNYKPSYDLESLLSSAFRPSTTTSACTSQCASVAEPATPSVSRISFADPDSVQDHLNDISTEMEPSVQEQLSDIPAGIDASPRNTESSLLSDPNLPLESNADSTMEFSHGSSKSLFVHHAHLLCISQSTARCEELLPEVGYDVVSVAVNPAFLLLLTSRGNVLSLPREVPPPHASGLTDVPLSSPPIPTLIPSLQLERAIRNKRFVVVACGESFSLALASSGEVYAWGVGARGELGLGDITEKMQPEVVVRTWSES